MFYIFLMFHILLFVESYFLFIKKQRRKGLIVIVLNTIFMIINLFKMYPMITKIDYSSITYIINLLKTHTISTILWLIFNIIFVALIGYIIYLTTSKKKQNRNIKIIIYCLIIILSFFFILVLFNGIASILLFVAIVIGIILLIKIYFKEKQNYILALILIIFVFLIYSFGTYIGAARLQIALQGYPVEAYNTGLEELKFYKEENTKKYIPIQEIKTNKGNMGIIQVKKYIIIKIGTFYEY